MTEIRKIAEDGKLIQVFQVKGGHDAIIRQMRDVVLKNEGEFSMALVENGRELVRIVWVGTGTVEARLSVDNFLPLLRGALKTARMEKYMRRYLQQAEAER